jgi:hypothetical protein
MRQVALMFQPGKGNGPPTWLVTLTSEVASYRKQGWHLLADVEDRSVRRVEVEPSIPPRYIWRLKKRPNHGSSGD